MLTHDTPVAEHSTSATGGARVGLWIAAILALAPVVIPFGFLVGRAMGGGSRALDTIVSGRTIELIASTTLLVAVVSASAAVIGVGAAWLTERTDLPGRKWWRMVAALPLVIPSYVIALTLVSALGPRGLLSDLMGFGFPTARGLVGAWWALTAATYPFVYLIVAAAIRRIDPTIEEAARGLGIAPGGVFRRVVLPQLRRPIGAGVLLAALYTLSDFGAVSLVGFDSFTRVIYAQYSGRLDRTPAMVLAIMLVVVALGAVWAAGRLRRGRRFTPRPSPRPTNLMTLSPTQRVGSVVALSVVGMASLGLPVGTLIAWLVRKPFPNGVPWGSMVGSITASLLAAGVAVLLAIPTAVLIVRRHSRGSAWVERTAYLTYSVPHITVGLAVVFLASRYLGPLYQSMWVLIAVYASIFFALALGSISTALAQINPNVEEAARSLGRSPLRTMTGITLPLISRSVAVGGLLVFLTTMKELPVTLLARPIGFDTLAVDVWSAAGELLYSAAAVPALLLLLVSALPTYLLATRQR